jgi:hypothetical protein
MHLHSRRIKVRLVEDSRHSKNGFVVITHDKSMLDTIFTDGNLSCKYNAETFSILALWHNLVFGRVCFRADTNRQRIHKVMRNILRQRAYHTAH